MRRSICSCEPSLVFAGDSPNLKFSYTTAVAIPKGAHLKFDLLSQGRAIDWQIPQTNLKEKENLIYAELPDGKSLAAKEIETPDSFQPSFEFILPCEIKTGEVFTIHIKGVRSQTYVQRRRPFHFYIDPKGRGDFREHEVFTLDVRGNKLHLIRIIVPSIVTKNRRFDVMVRFEDAFSNLTCNAPEGTLIELSYEHLRENLNWKLFVPETGFINLPNLYFNEPGIYKIQLFNNHTKEKFYSAPIKCFAENEHMTFWGLFHGESEKVDSTENIESCLRHFRDEKSLNFFATSPFESTEETSNDDWKRISTKTAEFNEDTRFSAFLGFQWCGDETCEGLRQIIYLRDQKPILRKKESKSNLLKKIYKSHTPKDFFSIPSFTMGKGSHSDFSDFTPEYEKVVEIYNAWGSSECTEKEGNLRPITFDGKKGISETATGSIRRALNRNCRFGFVAGGLDDRGIFADCYQSDQVQYSPGLTAIIAANQTRESLYLALCNRSCYATTGERIIIGFAVAGASMGKELSTKLKPGLVLNRYITGYVAGTAPLKEIVIIRNGEELHTIKTTSFKEEFTFDDSELMTKILLKSPDERPDFVYYYIRALQEDGHMAWSSPIWIDYHPEAPPVSKKPK